MSARIPPGFAEIWCRFELAGDAEVMYTSLGVDLAAGEGASLANANSLLAVMNTNLDNIVTNQYTLGPGHVIFGNDGGDIRIDGTGSGEAGDEAAPALPNNTALLVRKLTASGGRRNRGRMYIPGVPAAAVSATGNISVPYETEAQGIVNDIQSTLVGLAIVDSLVLFHQSAPFTPTPITDLEVMVKVATQRRRLRP